MSFLREFKYDVPGRNDIYGWSIVPDSATAVLHIVHGMMEHSGRYREFAEWMSGKGIAVYACDLPGHGLSVKDPEELGHIDKKNGWATILQALVYLQSRA